MPSLGTSICHRSSPKKDKRQKKKKKKKEKKRKEKKIALLLKLSLCPLVPNRNTETGAPAVVQCDRPSLGSRWDVGSIPSLAQWVRDLALPQMRLRS